MGKKSKKARKQAAQAVKERELAEAVAYGKAHAKESDAPRGHRVPVPAVVAIAAVVVAALLVLAAVFLPRIVAFNCYHVPSESMVDTLLVDDYVYSDRAFAKGEGVQAGDIVTFVDGNNSTQDSQTILVKRIVATAGQTVTLEGGKVLVDGVALDEPYATGQSLPLEGSQVTYPYTVPEGYVWCMGDNRENSADSRYFGAVPLGNITGKVVGICWPLTRAGAVG